MGRWFGPQTGDCSSCDANVCGCTSGTYPTNVSVTFADWMDSGDCDQCDEFNGSYVFAAGVVGSCLWTDTGSPSPCEATLAHYDIECTFSDDGANTVVTIIVSYTPAGGGIENWVKYKKTFSGRVSCDSFTDEAIPYDSEYAHPDNDSCAYEDLPAVPAADALLTTS